MKKEITSLDLEQYTWLCSIGKEVEAIDLFYLNYIAPAGDELIKKIQRQMSKAGQLLLSDELKKVQMTIQADIFGYESSQNAVFAEFTKKILCPATYKRLSITNPELKKAITNKALAEFQQKTRGSLAMTNADVLSSIRKLQTDLIKANIQIANKKAITGILDSEVAKFEKDLMKDIKKMNPDYYKQMEEGKLIKSRQLADGGYRNYTLESYSDMAVRTTLLNVDRTATEVKLMAEDLNFAEFYLRDNRKLKTGIERQICRHTIGQKFYGVSIVALNKETANLLEIPFIDDIRAEGAFGVYCRHSIRGTSDTYSEMIKKAVFISDAANNMEA